MGRRRGRGDWNSRGDVMLWALELSEVAWGVLKYVVRLPLLLLRFLV